MFLDDALDAHVQHIYKLAGHHAAAPPGVGPLALALSETGAFDVVRELGGGARLARRGGRWALVLDPTMGANAFGHEVSLAVADWYLATRLGSSEACRVELAARVILPTPALAIAVGLLAYTDDVIAEWLITTPEAVALRVRDMLHPRAYSTRERAPKSRRAG
jgi:hypothetical protein